MDNNTTIRTANSINYHLDWEREGHIVIDNPQTIELYHKLKYNDQPPAGDYFWAFSMEQFKQQLKAKKLEGKPLCRVGGGLYGTHEGIEALEAYYASVSERIRTECNPQEVYLYECNNHEYMYNWDGDEEALLLVIKYWGVDTARTIRRVRPVYSIEEIVERDKR